MNYHNALTECHDPDRNGLRLGRIHKFVLAGIRLRHTGQQR